LADTQALTDNFDNPQKIRDSVQEVVLDYLSVGIDPQKTTIFIQSQISEISELALYFMNLVTVARLRRNPTVKEEIQQKGYKSEVPVGFFVYPISQAADILFLKANLVPVGEDQKPMIELTREIARKFNSIYQEIFPEPEILVGDVARLPGIDGQAKMGKSLGNAIYLSDPSEQVEKKVMSMYTDPKRIHSTDPGTVEGNPVFTYLDAFGTESDKLQTTNYKLLYSKGQVGDIEVKKYLVKVLNNFLDPIRKNRARFEQDPELVERILKEGTGKARKEAQKTLTEVKKAMKLDYYG